MRWPPRCRTSERFRIAILKARGDRRRQHGRTAQVHVRATVRTNGNASAEATPPGTCSKPQSPSACGTQAQYLLPRRAAFEAKEGGPAVCSHEQRLPCAPAQAPGVPVACRHTWRRGRGETPGVPHAPTGEMRKARGRPACPRAGQRTGAMTRVWSSDARAV